MAEPAAGFHFRDGLVTYLFAIGDVECMIESLKRVFDRGPRPHEFCECRDCGTAVDSPTGTCPACGSREIARYDI